MDFIGVIHYPYTGIPQQPVSLPTPTPGAPWVNPPSNSPNPSGGQSSNNCSNDPCDRSSVPEDAARRSKLMGWLGHCGQDFIKPPCWDLITGSGDVKDALLNCLLDVLPWDKLSDIVQLIACIKGCIDEFNAGDPVNNGPYPWQFCSYNSIARGESCEECCERTAGTSPAARTQCYGCCERGAGLPSIGGGLIPS